MTIERLTHFANPANQRLSAEAYQILMEISADYAQHGEDFDAEAVRVLCGDDIVAVVDSVDFEEIKEEMFARAVLDGQAESEFWQS